MELPGDVERQVGVPKIRRGGSRDDKSDAGEDRQPVALQNGPERGCGARDALALDSVAAWADMRGSSNARSERRKREGARPVPVSGRPGGNRGSADDGEYGRAAAIVYPGAATV